MDAINGRCLELNKLDEQIVIRFCTECVKYAPQYGEGLDLLVDLGDRSQQLLSQVVGLRTTIQHGKRDFLRKKIEIIEKMKAI